MKNWFKEYKWHIAVSLALTMLPCLIGLLLWNQLPDVLTSHWGGDGVADGTASKAFMVFAVPAIMAGLNLLCMVVTALDPKQVGQNKKAMGIIFWIMPIICIAVTSCVYAIALGNSVDTFLIVPALLGALFVLIGNYMPKVKQNSRLGIKIFWTLHNEENWNKTHRFAGKLWVVGGLLVMLLTLLPNRLMVTVMIPAMLIIALAPMVYSFFIYLNHKQSGIRYDAPPATKSQKMTKIVSAVLVLAVLATVLMVMFTGDIVYTFGDTTLRIENSYVNGLELPYEDIDALELRENYEIGVRSMGFGSPRLSMGAFQNDEFEAYTLYSYNSCESMILIRSGNKWLAINAQTAEETMELYQTLLTKIS